MNRYFWFSPFALGAVIGVFVGFGFFVALLYLAGVFPEPTPWPM